MLLRKDSENNILNHVIEKNIEPLLTTHGFKYLRSKKRFEKGEKDFIQVLLIGKGSLSFSEEEEQLYYSFYLQFKIEHKLYEKWFEKEYNKKARLSHIVQSISVITAVDFDLLSKNDFYEPSKAIAFKHHISTLLSQHSPNLKTISLDTFLSNLKQYLLEIKELCNYRNLFATRPHPLEASYVNLLLYSKDTEMAIEVFQKNFDILSAEYEKAVVENSPHISAYLDDLKEYKVIGEKFLKIQFQMPIQIGFQSVCTNRVFDFSVMGLEYTELFTLDKPFRKIISYAVNPNNGCVIVGHQGQIFTVWSSNGELLLEVNMIYPDGYSKLHEFNVGYLPDAQVFYANNYIITKELDVFTLDIPLKKEKKDKYDISPRLMVPIAYSKELSSYILLFSHLKKNYVFFYDTNFKIFNQFETDYKGLDILPNRKWIATFEYMKKIILYDFYGKIVTELESNNATLGIGNFNYHDISKNENYLFSFFYHVKSSLFSLNDFNKKTLWGHTTFEKDYKELYYNDINHNFGVTPAKISPDEKYIVAGADHGKYVAWKLPIAERIELIPNNDFLKKLPDALVYNIGKNTYLKNRGNGIRDIQFYKNGDFYTTLINNDILIWDRNFVHFSTIENIGKIIPFTEEYILIQKEDMLSLFMNKIRY